jgi:tetratricopeptide (TPR) repeat protein
LQFILAAAQRRLDDPQAALSSLRKLGHGLSGAWGLHFESGMAEAALGQVSQAIRSLKQALALNPHSVLAAHALNDLLAATGAEADLQVLPVSLADSGLTSAVRHLIGHGDATALGGMGLHLSDIAATRLVSDVAARLDLVEGAEGLLKHLAARAPTYLPGRLSLAACLLRLDQPAQALVQISAAANLGASEAVLLPMRATAHAQTGQLETAIEAYRLAAGQRPGEASLWLSLGHAHKTAGAQEAAVAAYRSAIATGQNAGEGFWSLANLKAGRLDDQDRVDMERLLASSDLRDLDRIPLHFALGRALEERSLFAESFEHYRLGATLQKQRAPHDPDAHDRFVAQTGKTFTKEFFDRRLPSGPRRPGPIFVLGLPRSGSSLVEQILASHSRVEGTGELPDLPAIASGLAGQGDVQDYLSAVSNLSDQEASALGERYLTDTGRRRRLERPLFVDKFPGNFLHLGLITLILPGARIIDVRREPMACCWSLYRQLFARGQNYSYDLDHLGRYYRSYETVMGHFDASLPGRIHHLSYEALVADPELEIRRLLDHCGLAFEPACLEPHRTTRPVRTASSEQVRQPINRQGLENWRPFETWLAPLRKALDHAGPPSRKA